MKNIALLLAIVSIAYSLNAQHRCGTSIHNEKINHPAFNGQRPKFEEWIRSKRINKSRTLSTSSDEVKTIPVVFHVIYNGFDSNLEEARILDQMVTLNEDYLRQNPDATETPSYFVDVAANTKIKFELAKQDPEGLPTNGITRTYNPTSKFGFEEGDKISRIIHWPTDQYLNIWVVDMEVVKLGEAQFPNSDEPGLEGELELFYESDGVIMNYRYIGENYVTATKFQSYGRTLTHEIGHWLGLFHTFEGNCEIRDDDREIAIGGDWLYDTPAQSIDFQRKCPDEDVFGGCGTHKVMFQNYMDYTNDECMNLFTEDQSTRMNIILENSPRRKSLFSSKALEDPISYDLDLGISKIISPTFGNCSGLVNPSVMVRNYGSNDIDNFDIRLIKNNIVVESITVEDLDGSDSKIPILELETYEVMFSEIEIKSSDIIEFEILSVNGTGDENVDNNNKETTVFVAVDTSSPNLVFNNFEDQSFGQWATVNPDATTSNWIIRNTPFETDPNYALKLPYYGSSDDGMDYLISPSLDLSGASRFSLSFDYAYSKLSGIESDGLAIMISKDCGTTFEKDDILETMWATELATTTSNKLDFTPVGPGDWKSYSIDITDDKYLNKDDIVIAILGLNGNGNNIYLDNLMLEIEYFDYDLKIESISQVPLTTCSETLTINAEIKNNGGSVDAPVVVNNFTLTTTYGETTTVNEFNELEMNRGETEKIRFTINAPLKDPVKVEFKLSGPNGEEDDNPSDNYDSSFFVYAEEEDIIPIKLDFSNTFDYQDWTMIRPDQTTDLQIYTTEDFRQKHLQWPYFSVKDLGIENWFISPVLDLSGLDSASLRFEVSYGYRGGGDDRLQVLVSKDCGQNYNSIIYDKKDEDLATAETGTEWIPEEDEDWRLETVDISEFTGLSNVRVAFKGTGQNGNNIFVDDIEFFVTSTPPSKIDEPISTFPNPAQNEINVQLNFNNRDDITIQLISMSGDVLHKQFFPNSLNQIYTLQDLKLPNGIYVIHIFGGQTFLSSTVMINK
ncbi:T9SS-dependent choice-of-anchor J family protein [Reichenbachiella versicolor]|uniref:T9SS-dependent choice-of-anchor J family protein n=1 Tax=Reichenbachiella versicolor TaxID=1821036 RepID=UPI0013A5AAC5|nr:choice-of-anchor J domain-containing protein [Reichenbachiella versicolor]